MSIADLPNLVSYNNDTVNPFIYNENATDYYLYEITLKGSGNSGAVYPILSQICLPCGCDWCDCWWGICWCCGIKWCDCIENATIPTIPSVSIDVDATGLFGGYFIENPNITENASSVKNLNINLGNDNGTPDPLTFIFYDKFLNYTSGGFIITYTINGQSTTLNLTTQYLLTSVSWTWDGSLGTWYSQIEISDKILNNQPEVNGLTYNGYVNVYFILNANPSSSESWLQINVDVNISYYGWCSGNQTTKANAVIKSVTPYTTS